MRHFASLEEVASAVGTEVGRSSWIPVRQDEIDAFAQATGDEQWIHVDPARAADGPFGATVAHGLLTLSLIPRMFTEVFRMDFAAAVINYGFDRVRFPAPVPAGSRLSGVVEFTELSAAGRGHLLRATVRIEREHDDRPACVAQALTLIVAGEDG